MIPKGVASAIMEACQRDTASTLEIAKLVMSDPAPTGLLLEHAKAAAMGGRSVVSMADAVNRLGLRTVRHLALGFSLVDQYRAGACCLFDYNEFWNRSLLMAVTVRELGMSQPLAPAEELFVLVLLARVGVLALATAHPQEYATILGIGATGSELLMLEEEALAINHLELGAALLHRWGIPRVFIDAVLVHETLPLSRDTRETREESLQKLVHLALRISDCLCTSGGDTTAFVFDVTELASHFALGVTELNAAIDSIAMQWRQVAARLQLHVHPVPSFAAMTQAAHFGRGG